MLDRDIQVFDDFVVARDLVDQLVVELVDIEIVEPDDPRLYNARFKGFDKILKDNGCVLYNLSYGT